MTDEEDRAGRRARQEEAAQELTRHVRLFVLVVSRQRAETASRLGLTAGELLCLDLLRRRDDMSSAWLASRLDLGRSAVSKLLRRLERAGHVRRHPAPDHPQGITVTLEPHDLRDRAEGELEERIGSVMRELASRLGLDDDRRLADAAEVLLLASHAVAAVADEVAAARWQREFVEHRRRLRERAGPRSAR